MRHIRGWKAWEDHVNAELGLEATVASGSQFYDKGDGVDRSQSEYAYQVDAKFTEKASFSINYAKMGEWVSAATGVGKKFALAIRLWPRDRIVPSDYVVIRFDDFVDLLEKARHWEKNA